MKFQQIRNATVSITYKGKKFLVDPWLKDKESSPGCPCPFPEKNDLKIPTVDLPITIDEIIANVDAIIVTHVHPDHFEKETASMLNKSILVFVDSNESRKLVLDMGFENVTVLNDNGTVFEDVTLYRTKGMHGQSLETAMGEVCGVVFKSANEKTLYIAGDTVWYSEVKEEIEKHTPQIIVVNACGATATHVGRLIMHDEDVLEVCKAAPNTVVIASHMEAVNHATVTRDSLRRFLNENGIFKQVLIPDDGQSYTF